MNWKDIVASNERKDNSNPNLEKVISALQILFGDRQEVIESNILGVQYEEDLGRIKTIDKDYILDLIEDIRFAYKPNSLSSPEEAIKPRRAMDKLRAIARRI